MSVQRYDHNGYDIEPRQDGDYVRYEDFTLVFDALRVLLSVIENDPADLVFEESWCAIDDAQKIIDQYE